MFFARYNIDPMAQVGEFDTNKILAELEGRKRGILKSFMRLFN